MCLHQAPVVQRPISCSPGLKSFYFELFQSIFSDNFPHLPFAHLPLYTLFALLYACSLVSLKAEQNIFPFEGQNP